MTNGESRPPVLAVLAGLAGVIVAVGIGLGVYLGRPQDPLFLASLPPGDTVVFSEPEIAADLPFGLGRDCRRTWLTRWPGEGAGTLRVLRGDFRYETLEEAVRKDGYVEQTVDGQRLLVGPNHQCVHLSRDVLLYGAQPLVQEFLRIRDGKAESFQQSLDYNGKTVVAALPVGRWMAYGRGLPGMFGVLGRFGPIDPPKRAAEWSVGMSLEAGDADAYRATILLSVKGEHEIGAASGFLDQATAFVRSPARTVSGTLFEVRGLVDRTRLR